VSDSSCAQPAAVHSLRRSILHTCNSSLFAILRGLEGDETTLAEATKLGGVALPPLKSYDVQVTTLLLARTAVDLFAGSLFISRC